MSKRISEEIKQKIVERIRNEGLSVPKAAEEFGISRNAIYRWIGAKAKGEPSILEISKLKKENAQLKQIIGGLTLEMERGKKNQKRQGHGRKIE
jgi:transposase-like protein